MGDAMTKAPRPPLAKGDRVRVYGWVNMHHSPYKPRGGGPATVTYVEDSKFIHVMFDDEETHYSASPKQVRRLKKKPRPQKERVEWFEVVDENNKMQVGFGARAHAEIMVKANPSCRVAHLVELREGEAIVSREALAKAWNGPAAGHLCFDHYNISGPMFNALAEALGLPGKEQG